MKKIPSNRNTCEVPVNKIRDLVMCMWSFLEERGTSINETHLAHLLHSADSLIDDAPKESWDDWINDKEDCPEVAREEYKEFILTFKIGRAIHGVLRRQEDQEKLESYWRNLKERLAAEEIDEVKKQVNYELMNRVGQSGEDLDDGDEWECPECRDLDTENNSDVGEGKPKPFKLPEDINLN